MRRLITWTFSTGLMIPAAGAALGQDFPNKPIRIVTGGVGGNSDFSARLIAQGLSTSASWQAIVVNHSSGFIPAQVVSQAPGDGYTVLLSGSTFGFGHLLTKTPPPYDPERDFSPITLTNTAPNLVVVHPSLPVKSIHELIALAKAKPGQINYSSGVTGSTSQLAAETFNFMAGVKIQGIPYSSGSVRMADLIGGQVQLEFATLGAVAPHVKSGRLKVLAVTSAKRSALMPGVPTVAETGVPGYDVVGMTGMFAPAKTPATIINRLSQAIARAVHLPEIRQKYLDTGVEPVGNSPQEYAAKLKLERERVAQVIKSGAIRID